MAFIENSDKGALNGITEVTLIAAPPVSTRRVIKNITIVNLDTENVTLTLKLKDAGVYRTICSLTLTSGDILIYDEVLVLKATTESIVAVLDGAPATTNPDFIAIYGDSS